jgi:3-oxoacyl-[acyl-carrier protein] reductase
MKVDVRNRAQVDEMVKKGIDEFGKIDILVNNAGASSKMMPFMKMTSEDWDYDIGVNLFGQMNVAHAVLPHMVSREQGRIINTSGGQGIPTLSTYGAAKAGVVMFTRALAKEVQGSGVIVTVYSPGLGATGLTADDPRMDSIAPTLPLGRLCTPQDVAPIVAFLASDLSSYMAASMVGSH